MRQMVLVLIPDEISDTPVSQRIKFPLSLISIPLQTINSGSLVSLVSLLTCYPTGIRRERASKHRNLPERATGIRV